MGNHYARGERAWGVCARSGIKMLRRNMVFDGRFPNLLVHPNWREDKHPQEVLAKVEDPVAIFRPAPETVLAPSAPVLQGSLVAGPSVSLTWTPSENGITEMASYDIYRSIDGGEYDLLIHCPVLRDFLGGILGVQHCTTAYSIPNSPTEDLQEPAFIKQLHDDAPITYVDTTVSSGHTYNYFVQANPQGNTISVAQGPPSPQSNVVTETISAATTPSFLDEFTSFSGAFVAAGLFNGTIGKGVIRRAATPDGLATAADILVGSSELIALYSVGSVLLTIDGSGNPWTSADGGLTWSQGTFPAGLAIVLNQSAAVYDDVHNLIVVQLQDGSANPFVGRATPGAGPLTFTSVALPANATTTSLGYRPGSGVVLGLVLGGTQSSSVYRSTDGGATWSLASSNVFLTTPTNAHAILYGGTHWLAFGTDSSLRTVVVRSTDDGTTWGAAIPISAGSDSNLPNIGSDGAGNLVAIDNSSPANIYLSTDEGASWSNPGLFTNQGGWFALGVFRHVGAWYANFVALNGLSSFFASSPDGQTWTIGSTVVD